MSIGNLSTWIFGHLDVEHLGIGVFGIWGLGSYSYCTFVFAWKDWDVNVKNLNLGSCGLSGN